MMLAGSRPPRVALTPGEPAGIGPDLCVMLAQSSHAAELVAICDPGLLAERAACLGLPLELLPLDPIQRPSPQRPGTLRFHPSPAGTVRSVAGPPRATATTSLRMRSAVVPGRLDAGNAAYVLDSLRSASDGCLDGSFDALVTAPVHKGVINDAGLPFTGHTEFFAERCNASPVMMLIARGLRVALATTHLPLRAVADALTVERLTLVIDTLQRALRTGFGLPRPRILVCGLNPHAGEGGYLGREEIEVIVPVLESFRRQGCDMDLQGPLPADTAFVPEQIARVDAVLAMYHDQGLPVLKHLGFGQAVNMTLGLPMIRTSVDHGTALDLAGTGRAHLGSLEAALDLAMTMASKTMVDRAKLAAGKTDRERLGRDSLPDQQRDLQGF